MTERTRMLLARVKAEQDAGYRVRWWESNPEATLIIGLLLIALACMVL